MNHACVERLMVSHVLAWRRSRKKVRTIVRDPAALALDLVSRRLVTVGSGRAVPTCGTVALLVLSPSATQLASRRQRGGRPCPRHLRWNRRLAGKGRLAAPGHLLPARTAILWAAHHKAAVLAVCPWWPFWRLSA